MNNIAYHETKTSLDILQITAEFFFFITEHKNIIENLENFRMAKVPNYLLLSKQFKRLHHTEVSMVYKIFFKELNKNVLV